MEEEPSTRRTPAVAVAPMMKHTDQHFRYFVRLLTRHTQLYTEMVSLDAVLYNPQETLEFNAEEHPVTVQLGGSNPAGLARAARICQEWGYDEVNLNVGCPSKRVSKRCFGAKLMLNPPLVTEIMSAMYREVDIPVTVKCRIGVDDLDSYEYLYDFIDSVSTGVLPSSTTSDPEMSKRQITNVVASIKGDDNATREDEDDSDDDEQMKVNQWLASNASTDINSMKDIQLVEQRERRLRQQEAGKKVVEHFVIHARKALLLGRYSTIDNRRIPPLKYDTVYRLRREEKFSDLKFTINGGIETYDQIAHHLANGVDGVMLGRIATKDPWLLTQMDARFFGKHNPCLSRRQVLEKYCDYADRRLSERRWSKRGLLVPIVPLFYGTKDSRKFRQELNRALDEDKRQRPKNERDNWDVSTWDIVEEALRCVSEDTLDSQPPTCDIFDLTDQAS